MFRSPFRSAAILALGLVGGEFLDAAAASGLFLIPAAVQEKKHDEAKIELGEENMVSNKPLTVSIKKDLTRQLRSQIAEAIKLYPEATVRLMLGGVSPPAERKSIHGFKVFLNKPDATAATPADDPHYVASKEFAATTNGTTQGFAFDILKTLVALKNSDQLDILDPEEPLKVTIVANFAPGISRLPDEAWFSVDTLTIKVLKPEKH